MIAQVILRIEVSQETADRVNGEPVSDLLSFVEKEILWSDASFDQLKVLSLKEESDVS